LKASGEEFRILITPDHPTYLSTKTHTHGDVPFTICGTGVEADAAEAYCERTSTASGLSMPNGWDLMPFFVKGS
jgi:2,3-bisphosphoglycerate-independent phosphoglycerate mutase